MRELMSLLVVAAAISVEPLLVSVEAVAPVLLVDSLVAPTVLEGCCSVVDFDVSVVATELLGLVLEVVVSLGCVEVLDVLGVVEDVAVLGLVELEDVLGVLLAKVELLVLDDVVSVGWVEVLEVLGCVEDVVLGVVELEDVLGVLLARVELLELDDEELVLGVVEVVVCCACVWSWVRLASASLFASDGADVELLELGLVEEMELLELGLVVVAP